MHRPSYIPAALGALIVAAAAPSPVHAQSTEDEVVAVVVKLFDAMRARDSAMARSVFHPDARLVSTGARDGRPVVDMNGIEGFIEAIGSGDEPWNEEIYDVEVRIDDGLASVWNGYDLFVGDRFSHCGVDAFHLARTADGWKIIQVADTRRQEGCDAASSGGADPPASP